MGKEVGVKRNRVPERTCAVLYYCEMSGMKALLGEPTDNSSRVRRSRCDSEAFMRRSLQLPPTPSVVAKKQLETKLGLSDV
jgi:hypothetical protein